MRLLTIVALLAFAVSPAVAAAADKDEDKAKEAAVAFMKAVKAKDLDAVMKTVDVPFLFEGKKEEALTKTEDVKTAFEKLLAKVVPEKIPTEGGMVFDFATFGQKGEKEKAFAEMAEKFAGKSAYIVVFKSTAERSVPLVVRVKDGQAKVVWIPK